MKRHEALQPLSHDHHHGLVHALRLNRAAAGERPIEPVVADFLAFYPADLVRHFREEEDALGPLLLERCGAEDEQCARLFREHKAIHALVRDLSAARESGADLRAPAGALGDMLEKHIRFEERELFPRLEGLLTEEDLRALAPHFTGGPACAAPSKGPGA